MNYLVETHLVIWSLTDSKKLSKTARDMLSNEADTYYYSMASVWEVGIKHDLYTSEIAITAGQYADFCDKAGYRLLNISVAHIDELSSLKRVPEHRDPFDRLMLAQAKHEGFKLITHDSRLLLYSEDCVVHVPAGTPEKE